MSAPTTAKPATTAAPAKDDAKGTMFVLDTTAGPDTIDGAGRPISGSRHHEQEENGVKKGFIFTQGKPLEMPVAMALKFLRHDGFLRTDKDGNPVAYQRPPKQPEQLQAGEVLRLANDEVVARLDELTNAAIQHRALQMRGGEKFSENPSRVAMIEFIVQTKEKMAKAAAPQPTPELDEVELLDEAA